jgi:hypothetical protein
VQSLRDSVREQDRTPTFRCVQRRAQVILGRQAVSTKGFDPALHAGGLPSPPTVEYVKRPLLL